MKKKVIKIDSENIFQENLEQLLEKKFTLEILVIGTTGNDLKWCVALRIYEMIRNYYKEKNNWNIKVFFSYTLEEIVNNVKEMKPGDVHLLRLVLFKRPGLLSFINSQRTQEKHFIYIPDPNVPQNKVLKEAVNFCLLITGTDKKKIKCEERSLKTIAFSFPQKDLIGKFKQYKFVIIDSVFKSDLDKIQKKERK